ncbi:hypothetical protein A11A3_04840 [Alcanivorax hongdengensis A-11-3]|uniref:Outer membrane lipoprotein-sorting protein n=1 Tax=Alcanivorax hongdengensis A-11-3 TaxID=1177179 RepID=L0WEL5_9GAMM|nr:DUF1329 domain-containing protein [Alcanivorax hongdengensis]EKF75278.1 hypothetical protein A11A3_04840 [Alcanivorax hongdengensis A-11-3]
MFKKIAVMGGALALSLSMASGVQAGVSAQQAAQLGKTLTPFGAQVKGNGKATSTGLGIPDWTGGIQRKDIPKTYTHPGQHHPDPYASDKIAFTITAQNLGKYADKVPDGVQAMLKTYPDTFKLNVYPSHRSTSAPQWVYDNTKSNATSAVLEDTGVKNVFGGIPFPELYGSNSEKAREAIWNHILRWRGIYVVRRASEVAVQRNGAYSLVTSQQEVYFRYYDPKYSFNTLDNVIFYYLSFTKAPARLAGGAVLVHETLDQKKMPRQAWGYNAGQRRVRRAPNLAYDTPIAAADGLRTADDTDMYNGSPDKYNWSLVHEKPVEMFIPYNNYKIDSADISYEQLLQQGHVNPEYARWELHRVWVVEANLKEGERHIYTKRRFYIDADSWQIAAVDQYDRRGELWRVSLAYIKNYYEVPTQWSALDTFHDLRAKRYHVQLLDNEEPSILDFSQPVPDERYFHPAALRRRGRG